MTLYRKLEGASLTEGMPVQYLGAYVLKWKREWGECQCAFVEADDIAGVNTLLGWKAHPDHPWAWYGHLGKLCVITVYCQDGLAITPRWVVSFRLPGITPPLGQDFRTMEDAKTYAQALVDRWFNLITTDNNRKGE